MGISRKTVKPTQDQSSAMLPTESDIAGRAYELWQCRDGQAGSALEDWLQAERELQPVKQARMRKAA